MDTVDRETRSRIMAAVKSRRTGPEMRLRSLLHDLGMTNRGTRYNSVGDVCWPSAKVAIFLHGCFWHGCRRHYHEPKSNVEFWRGKIDNNRRRDRMTAARLRREGWRTLTIWEHDAKSAERMTPLIMGFIGAEANRRRLATRTRAPRSKSRYKAKTTI